MTRIGISKTVAPILSGLCAARTSILAGQGPLGRYRSWATVAHFYATAKIGQQCIQPRLPFPSLTLVSWWQWFILGKEGEVGAD